MKIVIHTWTHTFNIHQEHLKKYNETNFYFGLGDLIRLILYHKIKIT